MYTPSRGPNRAVLVASETSTPTDDESEKFITPPQSAISATKSSRQRVELQETPDTLNVAKPQTKQHHASRKKRSSKDSLDDRKSPKFTRTLSGRQSNAYEESIDTSAMADPSIPHVSPTSNDGLDASSFSSTIPSTVVSSFWSTGGRDGTITVDTSFATIADENLNDNVPSSGAGPTSSYCHALEELAGRYDIPAEEPVQSVRNPATEKLAEISGKPLEGPLRQDQSEPFPCKTRDGPPEHHQIRTLPQQGLFHNDIPPTMSDAPLRVRYECVRVALENGLSPEVIMPDRTTIFVDYEALRRHFRDHPVKLKLPWSGSKRAWSAAEADFENISMKGKLIFSSLNTGPLFQLRLEPLQTEKSCRFQRAFGGDRFLYLDVPSVRKIRDHSRLRQQEEYFQQRYSEWLLAEKCFLGRKWRVLRLETKKSTKVTHRSENESGQRIVLFATEGYKILPKVGTFGHGVTLGYSQRPETTLKELIDWFLPIDRNSQQPFCKAYARLDLGRSLLLPVQLIWS